jgi:hypothetical protein
MDFRKTADIKAKAIFCAKLVKKLKKKKKKTSPYHNVVEIRGELSTGNLVKLEQTTIQQSRVPYFGDVIILTFNKLCPRIHNNLIQ